MGAADVRAAMDDLHFLAEDAYRMHGQRHRAGEVESRFITATGYPKIVAEAAQHLYDRFYTAPHGYTAYAAIGDPVLRERFWGELSHANTGRGSWSEGWRIVGKVGEDLLLEGPDWERVSVAPQRFVPRQDGTGAAMLPREFPQRQQAFFHILGDVDHPPKSGVEEVRFYLNPIGVGAPKIVRALTGALNPAKIPFRFKIMSDPQRYARADGAVLYVPRSYIDELKGPLAGAWQQFHVYLRDETPKFTKRLAPGFAVAESPRGGESFGMHRCRLIAEAAWKAHADGTSDAQERHETSRAHFRKNAVDPDRPYLKEGNDDIY